MTGGCERSARDPAPRTSTLDDAGLVRSCRRWRRRGVSLVRLHAAVGHLGRPDRPVPPAVIVTPGWILEPRWRLPHRPSRHLLLSPVVTQVMPRDAALLPDTTQLRRRLPHRLAVAGVLVRLAELTALPTSIRGSGHLASDVTPHRARRSVCQHSASASAFRPQTASISAGFRFDLRVGLCPSDVRLNPHDTGNSRRQELSAEIVLPSGDVGESPPVPVPGLRIRCQCHRIAGLQELTELRCCGRAEAVRDAASRPLWSVDSDDPDSLTPTHNEGVPVDDTLDNLEPWPVIRIELSRGPCTRTSVTPVRTAADRCRRRKSGNSRNAEPEQWSSHCSAQSVVRGEDALV
jgi:hypothetical protein